MICMGRAKDGSNGLVHDEPQSVRTSPALLTPFNPSFSRRMARSLKEALIIIRQEKKILFPKPEES